MKKLGLRENKLYNQIVAHYTFFLKQRQQFGIVSKQRTTIVFAQLALLFNSN